MTDSTLGLRIRLVALCFLMLFVELALIRWLGGNILYLSYFSNIVLLGSFLGIGYRNLLIVAFLLYTAAVVAGRKHLRVTA